MWERSGPIPPRKADVHRPRNRLLRQQRLAEALSHDADRLLEQIIDLMTGLSRDGWDAGYRLIPDPDDPDRGDLARQLAARKATRRPATSPPEDGGDAVPYVSDGPPS